MARKRTVEAPLTRSGDVSIRRMRDEAGDYELLSRWLTDNRVLEHVLGRDNPFPLARVVAKYGPRTRGEDETIPCFIEHSGRTVGYLQYYSVERHTDEYALEGDQANTYGIDILIGEPELWSQGIGTTAVSALLDYLRAELGARRAVIDPRVDNARAIRCYEKCGFRKVKVLPRHELHEGEHQDCWLMVAELG